MHEVTCITSKMKIKSNIGSSGDCKVTNLVGQKVGTIGFFTAFLAFHHVN